MKIRNFYLVFGILFFSGRVYSQSCSSHMLIGIWKTGSSDSLSNMIFKDEKTVNIIYKKQNVVLHYTLNNLNNECIFSMQPTNSDSTTIIFSKFKMTDNDHFSLESYQFKNYNTKTKVWDDMNLPSGVFSYFVRSK
jgi:hypothetical protein